MNINVRESQLTDIKKIVDYFLLASPIYLKGMGADPQKLPNRKVWINHIKKEWEMELVSKSIFYLIWELNGQAIGHSNLTNIRFQHEANMHLHMWHASDRNQGLGTECVRKSLKIYFSLFHLQTLICEPYDLNPTPVKTLLSLGFKHVSTYHCRPGSICFEQNVKRFELSRDEFMDDHPVETNQSTE